MGDHPNVVVQQCAAAFGLHAMPTRSGMYGRLYDHECNINNFYSNYTKLASL